MRKILVTGLRAEADVFGADEQKSSTVVLCGAGRAQALAQKLREQLDRKPAFLISIGIAGGLDPKLQPGMILLGAAVRNGQERWRCERSWTSQASVRLPQALLVDIYGAETLASDPATKTKWHCAGADAVDMESLIVVREALAYGVPFAVLRVVADPADRWLPPAARLELTEEGNPDLPCVLWSLVSKPGQWRDLMLLRRDYNRAITALRHCQSALRDIL